MSAHFRHTVHRWCGGNVSIRKYQYAFRTKSRCNIARLQSEQADIWRIFDVMEITDALKGNTVVFTGHLGLARNDLTKIVERAGGRVENSVSLGVDFLVTNRDWTPGAIIGSKSNKFRRAEELGVKVLNEQEFIEFITANSPKPE